MSSYTAREVDRGISATEREDEWGDPEYGWDSFYRGNLGFSAEVEIAVPDELVPVETVAQSEEGENSGYGESIWVVVKVGDQFFKKAGYTSSYDGNNFDGSCQEVRPVVREVTFYV